MVPLLSLPPSLQDLTTIICCLPLSILSFKDLLKRTCPCSLFLIPPFYSWQLALWSTFASQASSFKMASSVLDWVTNEVQVQRYFKQFKGEFKGERFDSPCPPKRVFHNHPSCIPFAQFISDTILQRLASGAISVVGRVGEVDPPHLVMPVTVEPSKPR